MLSQTENTTTAAFCKDDVVIIFCSYWDLAKKGEDVGLLQYGSVLRFVHAKVSWQSLRPSMTVLSVKTIDCNRTCPQKHYNHLLFFIPEEKKKHLS